jgi:hypothetical protein
MNTQEGTLPLVNFNYVGQNNDRPHHGDNASVAFIILPSNDMFRVFHV